MPKLRRKCLSLSPAITSKRSASRRSRRIAFICPVFQSLQQFGESRRREGAGCLQMRLWLDQLNGQSLRSMIDDSITIQVSHLVLVSVQCHQQPVVTETLLGSPLCWTHGNPITTRHESLPPSREEVCSRH